MAPGHSVSSKFAFAEYQNNVHPQWWKDPGMRRGNLVILLYMVAQATGGYDKSLINNLQSIPTWQEGEFQAVELLVITISRHADTQC